MTSVFPHKGGYILEMKPGAPRDRLPKAVYLDGKFVTVVSGRVAFMGDGFLFTAKDSSADLKKTGGEFAYPVTQIECIMDLSRLVLWKNDDA